MYIVAHSHPLCIRYTSAQWTFQLLNGSFERYRTCCLQVCNPNFLLSFSNASNHPRVTTPYDLSFVSSVAWLSLLLSILCADSSV